MKQAKKQTKELDEDDKAYLEKKRAGTDPTTPMPRLTVQAQVLT